MALVVYHYTDEDGLKKIEASGYIRESKLSIADAAFGDGVYLTTISPQEGRKKISENNYGPGLGQHYENMGRVDRALKLTIPRNKLQRASLDRDIWVHKGNVKLSDYKYETIDLTPGDSFCAIL